MMAPNLVKFLPKLRYSNSPKHYRRTFCSKNEDTPKDDSFTSLNEHTDDFVESNCPAPKYTNVNNKKDMLDHLKDDVKQTLKFIKNPRKESFHKPFIPYHYDFAIFGAGPVGSTLANCLKERLKDDVGVIVIDHDISVNRFLKTEQAHIITPQLTTGHITQQFSLKENILLAKSSMDFFRNLDTSLNVFDDDPPKVTYRPFGHLTLATNKGHIMLKENHIQQSKYGVHTKLATAYQLSQRFPWLNVDDISIGCLGVANEGWIDPWEYMLAIRSAAMRRGTIFLEAAPVEFHFRETNTDVTGYQPGHYQSPHSIVVKETGGRLREIDFAVAVIALGSETGEFMKNLLFIDERNKQLHKLEVPITRKKHYVFCFESESPGPGLSSPLVNDPSGVYFRRDGILNEYVCGCTLPTEDPSSDNLHVDPSIFYDYVWPILAKRVPSFEKLILKSSWAYYEDHNKFDGSPIIGFHPAYLNIMICAGFGKHSFLYAPGIAKAVTEHVFNAYYETVDLTRFNFNRVVQEEPLVEPLII